MKFYIYVLLIMFTTNIHSQEFFMGEEKQTSKPPLLDNIQTGDLSDKTIMDFTLASDGDEVVLVYSAAGEQRVYAININDSNTDDANINTVSNDYSLDGIKTAILNTIAFGDIHIANIEVNPLTKAIYMLVRNRQRNQTAIVKLTNAGNDISVLDLSNIDYVSMKVFSDGLHISDMTFGDNKLFASSDTYSGENEIVTIPIPFTHDETSIKKKTSMHKSNWNNIFYVDAPLDYLCYGETSNGSKRIMGLTMCCPGYSIDIDDLTGIETLDVTEYFYFPGDLPQKVVAINTNGKTYMFSVYWRAIQRVGEHYIDGSITNPGDLNAHRHQLLPGGWSNSTPDLTEDDIKTYTAPTGTSYIMMSNYSESHILVLDNNYKLSLLAI